MEDQTGVIAGKARQYLASLTAGEVIKEIEDDARETPVQAASTNPAEAITAVAGVIRGFRGGPNYSDLT